MLFKTLLPMAALFAALTAGVVQAAQPTKAVGYRQFNILAVNDIYNVEGVDAGKSGSMARLRTLRRQMDKPGEPVLLLHAGDFLFPSSMSSQYKGEQMVDLMNGLDGDFSAFDDHFFVAFGNHEFDKRKMKYAKVLADRIEQSGFYWLGSNIQLDKAATKDTEGFRRSLLRNKIIEISGVKVGLFSLTTNIAQPEYATIDSDYLAVAKRNIAELKAKGAEVVLALTHLEISQDAELLKQLGDKGPDAVFGGHEHARQHICVGKRCVVKADADIRSATIATVTVAPNGEVDVQHRFFIVDDTTIESDPMLAQRTQHWLNRYQKEYCSAHKSEAGCLQQVFGRTDVTLKAEELEIRRFETNLGSFVTDQMIHAFDNVKLQGGHKVQAALLNSGSLRLNQNIPAGTELTDWYLNAIFQYPVKLRVLDISGKQLRQAIEHSVSDWTGNGKYLQISGIAFRHDTQSGKATDLSLVDAQGNITPIKDTDNLRVVVNNYMVDPSIGDQDGYTMFNLKQQIPYAGDLIELKDVVRQVIADKWKQGKAISPKAAGRVCNSERPQSFCILDKAK